MQLKKFGFAIIIITVFCSTLSVGCKKKGTEVGDINCSDLESEADAAVARYYQVQTKAACDSARDALKEAADCDGSYKNQYDAFPTCP
jgi:hypothetical protein